jgi:CRP-like cAMP-binding protein
MADELPLEELAKFSKLFEVLDEEGRKQLLGLSRKIHLEPGAEVCKEGDPGDEFYVVVAGKVKVTADDFGNAKELATLGIGQFFGEMAVLSGTPRQATVTAMTKVELVGFPRPAVDAVLASYPAVRGVLNKVGLARTEDTLQKMMS